MIDFFIIQNKTKVPLIYSTSNKDDRGIAYRPCLESLEKQAKELGVTINVKPVELNEIPTSTKSLLVGFLCENNLIPDDYLGRVLSLNNLYRSANGFIGNHTAIYNYNQDNGIDPEIVQSYHKRIVGSDWNKNSLMEYTEDIIKIPLIYGAIFNGYYYNSNGGFTATLTPRTISPVSPCLINKENQLIWSKRLNIFEFIPTLEMNDLTFGNWFYEMGFFSKERHDNDPDLLLLKSKFSRDSEARKKIDFLCWMYDTGCYESFLGYKLG